LLSIEPVQISEFYTLLIRAIRESGHIGVLVLTTRPYRWWVKMAGKDGTSLSGLRFVDCVGELETFGDPGVRYATIEDLDSIKKAIESSVEAELAERFIVMLESLVPICLYHSEEKAKEFATWFKDRIIQLGSKGLVIYAGSAYPELFDHISGLADRKLVL
jgi:hypothetical protein